MIRTRFAPSPTGFLHVGGLRTALYNYLFAKKNQGTFILRIEDTDQNRFVEGAVESLLNTLKQVGLEYDEGPEKEGSFGPYIQSQRTELYRQHAQELLEKKAAYLCFCTPERLEEMREKQIAMKRAPMYDRTCLSLTSEEIEKKKQEGIPYVIRQKIPHGRFLKFKDLIRGKVSFETATIDDQILMKSDNFPTYHLANVVDDHLMQITHVIRGEEWLPSTPKHLLLYEAFGWTPPEFAHIPLLLNKDKTKLSKRQGDVSVESYLQKGYIKEALLNFIVLLGWHPGKGVEQEIFTLQELIETFSLEQVHKAGAIFDLEKLDWFNFQWKRKIYQQKLMELSQQIDSESHCTFNEKSELVCDFNTLEKRKNFEDKRAQLLQEMCLKYLSGTWQEPQNASTLSKGLITIEEKILKKPEETSNNIRFYFEMNEKYPLELIFNEKMQVTAEIAKQSLENAYQEIKNNLKEWDNIQSIRDLLIELAKKLGIKNGQLLWPLRVVLTGEQYSPGVYEVLWALGKEKSLERIEKGLKKME